MGLLEAISGAVDTAFAVVTEATVPVLLRVNPAAAAGASYDPVTGTYTGGTVGEIAALGVLYQSRTQKLSDDAANTASVLIRVKDLADGGFTGVITNSDEIMIAGVKWAISRADKDPLGVTWIIELRK